MYHVDLSLDRVLERVASPRPSLPDSNGGRLGGSLENHEASMLVDDIRLRLCYGRGLEGSEIEPTLNPDTSKVRSVVAYALSSQLHRRAATAVKDFFEDCWRDLAAHEVAVHEIAFERERNDSGLAPPDQFRLFRMDPRSIHERQGTLFQKASPEDQSEFGLPDDIPVEGDWFAVLRLPDELRGPLREALQRLRGTDAHEVLASFPPWEQPPVRRSGAYNFQDHVATRRAVIAGATREIGWNARDGFREDINSHYLVRREIRFGRYVAALRNLLTDHLNDTLRKASGAMGFQVEVELKGAPRTGHYDAAERALDEGSKTFRDILSALGR